MPDDDVDGLYQAFRAGLKETYGRIPTRGLPRVGQRTGAERHHGPAPEETFARALHFASLLADSEGDAAGAAKVIDRVLRLTDETPTPVQPLQLLVLRADVAGRLGDEEETEPALARAAALDLTEAERHQGRDALTRLADLRGSPRR